MKKKIVAMMLTLAMAASVLAGCGSTPAPAPEKEAEVEQEVEAEAEEEAEAEVEAEEEGYAYDAYAGTELNISVYKHPSDQGKSYAEKPGMIMAEEATGIKVNWTEVPDGQSEQVDALLAGDMPDIMIAQVGETTIASDPDLFYDLSEEGLLETYAPDLYKLMQDINGGYDQFKWPDGSIRSLPGGYETLKENDPDGIMVINKKWLEKVGKEVPTTAEEFYDVMCAFRDNDMNGNGDTTDEIPFMVTQAAWQSKIIQGANSWGIAGYNQNTNSHYFMVKDGVVTPTVDTDEFRAFLEYYNMMMNEGLMNMDAFTCSTEQQAARLSSDQVGVYYSWTPISGTADPEAWVVFPPFQALDGVEPVKTGEKNRSRLNKTMFVISADCENVEAALTWINYISSSTDVKWTVRYGEEDGRWTYNADGNIVLQTPDMVDGIDFTVQTYQYTYGWGDNSPLLMTEELHVIDSDDMLDSTVYRAYMVDGVWDMLQDEYIPKKFVDPAKLDERAFMETEINAYLENFVATAITEGVTDASWEAHLEQLKAVQFYDWIEWYQGYVDGEF